MARIIPTYYSTPQHTRFKIRPLQRIRPFKQVLESHLPLIIDIKLDQEIEDDLTQTSHKFRGAIQKFLKNKKKAKLSYPDKKTYDFALHELVMRKEYTPSTPLKPTYVGPYRIMELFPQ